MAKAVLSFGEHEHTSRLAKYVEEESKHNRPVHLGDGNKIRDYMRVDKAHERNCSTLIPKTNRPNKYLLWCGHFHSRICQQYCSPTKMSTIYI